jgi:hypothetical protein
MAKKKTVPKQTTREIDKRLDALEAGLRGLGDVSKGLNKVRANLRKYLDDAERSLGTFPRRIPRPIAKTRQR